VHPGWKAHTHQIAILCAAIQPTSQPTKILPSLSFPQIWHLCLGHHCPLASLWQRSVHRRGLQGRRDLSHNTYDQSPFTMFQASASVSHELGNRTSRSRVLEKQICPNNRRNRYYIQRDWPNVGAPDLHRSLGTVQRACTPTEIHDGRSLGPDSL